MAAPAMTWQQPKVFHIPSSSRPGQLYTVHLAAAGPGSCTCPAYKFTRGPRSQAKCKHMREAAARKVAA